MDFYHTLKQWEYEYINKGVRNMCEGVKRQAVHLYILL